MISKSDAVISLGFSGTFWELSSGEIKFAVNNNENKPTEEEIQAKIAELEAAEPMRLLREERNKKLAETDWRATVDYPGDDKQLWLDYRQALRDVTEQDPNNVIWPEEPA